ncbi:hypothetical protein DACRYDRAFT_114755 [Dacryopinax primogenitus]|uniref:Uncharacterized protein n=1 Tax=Dacryopinax primogenitus (strain DJM 731) TaxID=1858805 RepID=M5GDC4_DACPD|nr:uncharacterized protein DACRYDRAFT_114755 [Dacryopinax primogenitus]EJU04427.1 hypothetical protein DACRYDRAFT_114755 [Dacryopinax primogenitus]
MSDISPMSSPGGSRSSFLTDNIREDASSHSGMEPMDEVAQYLADARRAEENNRPERWFNPDQDDEVNDKQDALHEDVLQEFCAMLCANSEDDHINDWHMRRADIKYAIFHEVYVAVYEARKDVLFEDESWGELFALYLAFFMGTVEANTDRRPDPSLMLENVPGLTPDRGMTPDRYSPAYSSRSLSSRRGTPERGSTPERGGSPQWGAPLRRWLTPEQRIAFSRPGTPEREASPMLAGTPERAGTPDSEPRSSEWRFPVDRRLTPDSGPASTRADSPASSQITPNRNTRVDADRDAMMLERRTLSDAARTASPHSQHSQHSQRPHGPAALVDGVYS